MEKRRKTPVIDTLQKITKTKKKKNNVRILEKRQKTPEINT